MLLTSTTNWFKSTKPTYICLWEIRCLNRVCFNQNLDVLNRYYFNFSNKALGDMQTSTTSKTSLQREPKTTWVLASMGNPTLSEWGFPGSSRTQQRWSGSYLWPRLPLHTHVEADKQQKSQSWQHSLMWQQKCSTSHSGFHTSPVGCSRQTLPCLCSSENAKKAPLTTELISTSSPCKLSWGRCS